MTIYDAIELLKDETYRLGFITERDLTEEEESLLSNALTAIRLVS